jgi:hypothetical protein
MSVVFFLLLLYRVIYHQIIIDEPCRVYFYLMWNNDINLITNDTLFTQIVILLTYVVKYYMIFDALFIHDRFVNDLGYVVGFLRVLWFPQQIKLTVTI